MLTPDPHRLEKERWDAALLGPKVNWPVNQATAVPHAIIVDNVSATSLEVILSACGYTIEEQLVEEFLRIALGHLDLKELEETASALWNTRSFDVQQHEAVSVTPLNVTQKSHYVLLTQSLMQDEAESWKGRPETNLCPKIIIEVPSQKGKGYPRLIVSLGEASLQVSDAHLKERWAFIREFFNELQRTIPQPLDEYVSQQDIQSASIALDGYVLKLQRRDLDPNQYLSMVQPSPREPGSDLLFALTKPSELRAVLVGLKVHLPYGVIEYLYSSAYHDNNSLSPEAFRTLYGQNLEFQFSRSSSCELADGEIELAAVYSLELETTFGTAFLSLNLEQPDAANQSAPWLRACLTFDQRSLRFPARDWKQFLNTCSKIIIDEESFEEGEE